MVVNKILNQLKQHSLIETILAALILSLGFSFRLQQYIFNRSLWLDEALLANNLVSKSIVSLLFQALDFDQAAPPGFLFLVKIGNRLFGTSDIALRLVPFAAGVFALITAYFIARTVLKTALGRVAFLCSVAFSPSLIYYSSEFKQYSLDVFLAVLLILMGLSYKKWKMGFLIFTLCGMIFPWFSHPTVFVLAAIGVTDLVVGIIGKDDQGVKKLFLMVMAWLLSFTIFYIVSLHMVTSDGFLQNFWAHGYAPFPPMSWEDAQWYLNRIYQWTFLSFQQLGPPPVTAIQPWFLAHNIILSISLWIGGVFLWFRSKRLFGILIGPVLITLLMSIPELYPFSGRLILFLVPLGILIISNFVDVLASQTLQWRKSVAVIFFVFSVTVSLRVSLPNLLHPFDNHNIKGAMYFLKDQYREGDVVAISRWSLPAYTFYSRNIRLENLPMAAVIEVQNDVKQMISSLCGYGEPGRVWILFSHRFSERHKLLDILAEKYDVLSRWEGEGSGIYLWDLTNVCYP